MILSSLGKSAKNPLFRRTAIIVFLVISTVTVMLSGYLESAKLQIGIFNGWATLRPGLQHTLVDDLILMNQFDPLVGCNESGAVAPLAARGWAVSEDYRTFSFQIDTSLRFSDGSALEAADFKRSWEQALRLEPKSANSSLQDVLYKLEGYETISITGAISGIEVHGSDKLVLRFKTPFRMALSHLGGVRFAAFKEREGKFLGTGRYVISELSPERLLLTPNPFSKDRETLSPIELIPVPGRQLSEAFARDEIDAWGYGFADEVPATVYSDRSLEIVAGLEAVHQVVEVNGSRGRIFEDAKARQALLYLLTEFLRNTPTLLGDSRGVRVDVQPFLPLQAGRLSEDESRAIVEEGARHLQRLIELSRERPIVVHAAPFGPWFVDAIRKLGLTISPESKVLSGGDMPESYYKKHDYDLLYTGMSVVTGDPDGIYHALGKHGAILNPVIYRSGVGDLLEEGRRLLDPKSLDAHYQNVSRAILREIPFIHLGFARSVAIFRPNRVRLEGYALRRNEGHFHVFRQVGWNPL